LLAPGLGSAQVCSSLLTIFILGHLHVLLKRQLAFQFTMNGTINESIFLPLDKSKAEIRLLHLRPRAVARDEITCNIRLADLNTKDCEYEALSYEWSIATNRIFTIVINEDESLSGKICGGRRGS
jgi:hypothetical protein